MLSSSDTTRLFNSSILKKDYNYSPADKSCTKKTYVSSVLYVSTRELDRDTTGVRATPVEALELMPAWEERERVGVLLATGDVEGFILARVLLTVRLATDAML